MTPIFKIVANSNDITKTIQERFKSLRLTDETGTISDTVEISLADNIPDKRVQVPPTGAELDISIGYDTTLKRKGLFVVDEIELSGYPCELVIRARAAPFEASRNGMKDLQSHKTRSWPKGTTLGAMVKRIAGEHRLKPLISPALASIALPHTDQSRESDMNLLVRLARRYDAITKPADGLLVFARRGAAKSKGITLTPQDGGRYRVTIAGKDSAGTVVAYYRDTRKAQRREVTIGDGDPVVQLRMAYADRVSAENAARAKQRSRARAERRLTYTFPGDPEVVAEAVATMQGFRDGVDGDWLITRAEHYVGPDGYRTTIECVQPNSVEDARDASSADAVDSEQGAKEVV